MKSLSLPPIDLLDLQSIARDPDQVDWQYFQDGVDIFRIYGDGNSGPCASLLRFQKDGQIPLHKHVGYEHLFILTGSQTDDQGTAQAGSLIINPPGTRHRVTSESGCIVLAIYEKPVAFL
ncbi:MAG: cupin domain-containing protein [Chthoniobacterales bacterium]